MDAITSYVTVGHTFVMFVVLVRLRGLQASVINIWLRIMVVHLNLRRICRIGEMYNASLGL